MKRAFFGKTVLILTVSLLLTLGLGACSQALDTLNTAAEAVATPVPVPTAEPVITTGDAMTVPLSDSSAVPTGYTRVTLEDPNIALFAFTDQEGKVEYRVYGGYTTFVDGVADKSTNGFYPSDETGAILSDSAEAFVDPATEAFGVCDNATLPDTLRLRAKYTLLENGLITGTEGGTFVYGSFAGGEGAFYPADSTGKMVAGALPTTEKIAVPSYTPTSVPTADGDRMIIVYIGTQSVVVYKAVDGEWTEERVMICSTGRSKDLTPRGDFNLVRQYPYKKMGQVHGENVYSQYASRITGSYLFLLGSDRRRQPQSSGIRQEADDCEVLRVAGHHCLRRMRSTSLRRCLLDLYELRRWNANHHYG